MNPRTKAALIGGVAGGLLSAIVSVIPLVSCCCCLLSIGGGILAVFLYTKDTKATMTPGDGAAFGAVAGGGAAAIYFVINFALNLIIGTAAMAAQMEQMQRAGVSIPSFFGGMLGIALFSLIGAVGVFVLTLLGGVIGSALFGKGAGTAPPPPPPGGFGGPGAPGAPGGGYGQGM
jgi:hypothetical protein